MLWRYTCTYDLQACFWCTNIHIYLYCVHHAVMLGHVSCLSRAFRCGLLAFLASAHLGKSAEFISVLGGEPPPIVPNVQWKHLICLVIPPVSLFVISSLYRSAKNWISQSGIPIIKIHTAEVTKRSRTKSKVYNRILWRKTEERSTKRGHVCLVGPLLENCKSNQIVCNLPFFVKYSAWTFCRCVKHMNFFWQ